MSTSTLKFTHIGPSGLNTIDIRVCTKDKLHAAIKNHRYVFIIGCFEEDPTGEKDQIENRNMTLALLDMLCLDEFIKADRYGRIYVLGLKKTKLPEEALLSKTNLRFNAGVWPEGIPRPEMMIAVQKQQLVLSGMNFIPSNFGTMQFNSKLRFAPGELADRDLFTGELIIQAILKGGNRKNFPAKSIKNPAVFEADALKHGIVVDVAGNVVNGTSLPTFGAFIEAYNDAVVAIMCRPETKDKKAKELGGIIALDEKYFVESKGKCIPVGELGSVASVGDIGLNIVAQGLGYALRLEDAEFLRFIQILIKNNIQVMESAIYPRRYGYYVDNSFGGDGGLQFSPHPEDIENGPECFFNAMGNGIELAKHLVAQGGLMSEAQKAHLKIMGVDCCVVETTGEINKAALETVKAHMTRLMFSRAEFSH